MKPHRSSPGFLRSRIVIAAALALATCFGGAIAGNAAPPAAAEGRTALRVERVRPRREAFPSLRFLKANRDFFRSQLDLLRERPLAQESRARGIDPRFLAWRDVMNEALAANDSLNGAADVAALELELDRMDRALSGGRTRLAALQADFSGRQRTSMAIVVSGYPQDAELDSLTIRFDDGSSCKVEISVEARESLRHRGMLEVFHGLIEPREQVLEISVAGRRLAGPGAAFVTVSPLRDRLTFLQLDVSALRPATGAPKIVASTWLHDDAFSTNGEPPSHP